MLKFLVVIFLISSLFERNSAHAPANKLSDDALQETHLRVYAYEYPPLMYPVKDHNGNATAYQGFTVSFINYLAQHFNLELEFVPENKKDVEREGQGRAARLAIGKRKIVDFSTYPIPADRIWPLADFTSNAYEEGFILLCPWPEEESRLAAVIMPFDLTTWILIIISTVALIIFLSILIFLYYYWRKRFGLPLRGNSVGSFSRLLGSSTMYVVSILGHQANRLKYGGVIIMSRLSIRLMVGLWLLGTIILMNFYGSTLTSYLTSTKMKPIPNSIEELAKNYDDQKCLITLQKGHSFLEMFKNSKYPPYERIYQWVVSNPQFLAKEYHETTKNVVDKGCTHIGTPLSSGLRVAIDFKSYGKCRMTTSKPLDLATMKFAFALQKNSPYTQSVNKYLLQANAAGLMDYWKKWSYGNLNMDVCNLDSNSKTKVKPIKLVELSSAFFVLGLGLTLATIVFLLERIHGFWIALNNRVIVV